MASHAALNMAQSRQTGLSLLEVLIAIAILGIGVLGLAQMQAFGLLNVERAYQRSQATVLAYAIADKMRANVTTANNYLTEFMPADEASAQPDCKTTSGCTVAALAENDLFEWNEELTAQLPGATGTIVLVDGNYTVAIIWDDNGDGEVCGESDDCPAEERDPSFEVSFAL